MITPLPPQSSGPSADWEAILTFVHVLVWFCGVLGMSFLCTFALRRPPGEPPRRY